MTRKKRYPPKFVLRTIRNGSVQILGKTYRPSGPDTNDHEIAYDGRLDGQRWAFGLYWYGGKQEEVVELWGTEALKRAPDEATFNAEYKKQPNCWLDEATGQWLSNWNFWYTDAERARRIAMHKEITR